MTKQEITDEAARIVASTGVPYSFGMQVQSEIVALVYRAIGPKKRRTVSPEELARRSAQMRDMNTKKEPAL